MKNIEILNFTLRLQEVTKHQILSHCSFILLYPHCRLCELPSFARLLHLCLLHSQNSQNISLFFQCQSWMSDAPCMRISMGTICLIVLLFLMGELNWWINQRDSGIILVSLREGPFLPSTHIKHATDALAKVKAGMTDTSAVAHWLFIDQMCSIKLLDIYYTWYCVMTLIP